LFILPILQTAVQKVSTWHQLSGLTHVAMRKLADTWILWQIIYVIRFVDSYSLKLNLTVLGGS